MPEFGFAPGTLRFLVVRPPDLEQKHAKSRRETGFPGRTHSAALCGLLFKIEPAARGSAVMSKGGLIASLLPMAACA